MRQCTRHIYSLLLYGISVQLNIYQGFLLVNPLRAAGKKGRQYGTSWSHGQGEKLTEKHLPVSEGISWEPRTISSHTAPQKIAKKISFK